MKEAFRIVVLVPAFVRVVTIVIRLHFCDRIVLRVLWPIFRLVLTVLGGRVMIVGLAMEVAGCVALFVLLLGELWVVLVGFRAAVVMSLGFRLVVRVLAAVSVPISIPVSLV